MAFTAKPPKSLARKTPFSSEASLKAGRGFAAQAKPPSLAEQRQAQDKALQKATLRALDKARSEASAAGIDLSEWEAEFLDSVSQRVETYGRAFADPDKGAMNGTLSLRQGIKLKEIRKKARKGKSNDPAP